MIYISSTSVAGCTGRHTYQPVLLSTIRTLIGQKFNNIAPLLTTIYEEEQVYRKRWSLLTEIHPDLLSIEFEPPYPPNLLNREKYYLFYSQIPPESLRWIEERIVGFTPKKYQSERDRISPLYLEIQKIPEYQILTTATSLTSREATIASISLESKIRELTQDSEISSSLDRQISMDRGTRLESTALQEFSAQTSLLLATEEKNSNSTLTTPKGNRYKVGGRTDGTIVSGPTPIGIVEIKTRLGGFHTKDNMPGYDVDQLAVYWYLTKYNNYYLVEFYEGEISITEYSATELQERWGQIRPLLDNWVDEIIPIVERSKKYLSLSPDLPTLDLDELSSKVREIINSI